MTAYFFSLAFSSFACSLLRGFYLLLVLHSFKKVCNPFSFTCTVVFSGTFGHARTLKRGENGSSCSSSSSRTVQLITLDRQINGQRIEFALWGSSFLQRAKREQEQKDMPVSKWYCHSVCCTFFVFQTGKMLNKTILSDIFTLFLPSLFLFCNPLLNLNLMNSSRHTHTLLCNCFSIVVDNFFSSITFGWRKWGCTHK